MLTRGPGLYERVPPLCVCCQTLPEPGHPVSINRLQIKNLRNIEYADLYFSPQLNLIQGDNGSGKSTLIEAIYLTGRGRSYRTARFGSVIRHGEKSATLFADSTTNQNHRIGIEKTAQTTRVRIDGRDIHKLSEIARITPLQIITPMSHEILERGPEYRRRFVEWGVFHVEHHYFSLYRHYLKNLRQRNMALRQQTTSLSAWDSALATLGEDLNSMREHYFHLLVDEFQRQATQLELNVDISFSWRRGWSENTSFAEALTQNLESDLQRGYTQSGPHRADFKLTMNGRSAFNSASRGQQKMLIISLHLAQAIILRAKTGIIPIILIDDLVSELDQTNRNRLVKYLSNLDLQIFITSTDAVEIPEKVPVTGYCVDDGKFRRTECPV